MNRETGGRWRRIRALIVKETLQVSRDPSSFVVAFVLPALLLFLFGFGISFDATRLKIGLVIESRRRHARIPHRAHQHALFRRAAIDGPTCVLSGGKINGVIVLGGDFAERLARGDTAEIDRHRRQRPEHCKPRRRLYAGAWASWRAQRASAPAPALRARSPSSPLLVQPRTRKPKPGAKPRSSTPVTRSPCQLAAQDAERIMPLLARPVVPALEGGDAEADRLAADRMAPLPRGERVEPTMQRALSRRRRPAGRLPKSESAPTARGPVDLVSPTR